MSYCHIIIVTNYFIWKPIPFLRANKRENGMQWLIPFQYRVGHEFFCECWTWKREAWIFRLTRRKRWSLPIQSERTKDCFRGIYILNFILLKRKFLHLFYLVVKEGRAIWSFCYRYSRISHLWICHLSGWCSWLLHWKHEPFQFLLLLMFTRIKYTSQSA